MRVLLWALAVGTAWAWGGGIECKFGPDLVGQLTAPAGCHSLELAWSKLGVAKLRSLAVPMVQSAHSLREIELKGNALGDAGIRELAFMAGNFSVLAELELASNDVADAGAIALSEALPSLGSLVDLDLGANRITATGASQLIIAAKPSSLIELDLAFNSINDSVVPAVEHLFENPGLTTVRKLKLSGNLLSAASVERLRQLEAAARSAGHYIKISSGVQRAPDQQPNAPIVPPVVQAPEPVAAAPGPTAPQFTLSVAEWTDGDVAAWIKSLSPALAVYADAFQANAVNGDMLLSLSDSDLKILGVDNTFHRQRLMNELQKLQ